MEFKQNYLIDINDYKMINKINEGGFGSVYKARNKKTNEILAAKVATGGSQNLKMINREIKIMIHFNHPTIVKLIGYSTKDFWDNNVATIFMKLEKNGSLRDAIKKASKGLATDYYDDTAKQIILIGIAYGMMILHKNNVIHRDLKPENVLLDENLHPIITDFGLSKFFDVGHSMSQSMQSGTMAYMAPEILSGDEYNSKVDVYSFGILMYEVITNNNPYPALSTKKMNIVILTKLITQDDFHPQFDKGIKKSFQKLLTQCWSKNPNERPTFEEIYYKLAYNFDNFITNYEEVEEEENNEGKYFLPNVDKDAIEDYLNEIENSDHDIFQIQSLNEKIQKIEKKIETSDQARNDNKKVLDKINEIEQGTNKKISQLNMDQKDFIEAQNEKISFLKKENNEYKEKFNSLQLEFIEMKKQFEKCFSNQANRENKKLEDDITLIKSEIESIKSRIGAPAPIPDDLLERLNNAEKNINQLRGDNTRINHDLNCMKYEVKKLKDAPVPIQERAILIPAEIPDDLLERLNNAEKNINQLRGEQTRINHDLNCMKYEVKKLKQRPVRTSYVSAKPSEEGEQTPAPVAIPDELYLDLQNAQEGSNKANSKCDKLKAENVKLIEDLNLKLRHIKFVLKKLKEISAQYQDE